MPNPTIRFEPPPRRDFFPGDKLSLPLRVEPKAKSKQRARIEGPILAKPVSVSLKQSTTTSVTFLDAVTAKQSAQPIQLVPEGTLAAHASQARLEVTLHPFPEISLVEVESLVNAPGLAPGELPRGKARITLRVSGRVPESGAEVELSLREPVFKGNKSKIKHVVRLPTPAAESGDVVVEVELVKTTEFTIPLTLKPLKRCRAGATTSLDVKVVPPTASLTDAGTPLLVKHGEKAKLEVALSYALTTSREVVLQCSAFGEKTVKIPAGQTSATLELSVDKGFDKPQEVTVGQRQGKYQVQEDAAKRTIQAAPQVQWADAWVTPAQGPYKAGAEVTFAVRLSGPAPTGGATAKLVSAALEGGSKEVSFAQGAGVDPVEVRARLVLPAAGAGQHEVRLEAVGDACWAAAPKKSATKQLELADKPAAALAEGPEWISPSGGWHVGDKVAVKVSLGATPTDSDATLRLASGALSAPVTVTFPRDTAQLEQTVELTLANKGSHTLALEVEGDGAVLGKRVKEKLSVAAARTVTLARLTPDPAKTRVYHGDVITVGFALSAPAEVGEVIATLRLTHAKGGQGFSQDEVELRTLEGEKTIEARVRVDAPGLTAEDTLTLELVAKTADVQRPHQLGAKPSQVKRTLPIHPMPTLELAAQPFTKQPAKEKQGTQVRYVFSVNEQPTLTAQLQHPAPQAGARAKLTCAGVFEAPAEYELEWEPGEKKSKPLAITLAKDPGGNHEAELKLEPAEHEHEGLTLARCGGSSTVPIKIGEETKLDLAQDEEWFTPRGPAQKGRDKVKLKLQLGGKAPPAPAQVRIECGAFERNPFDVTIPPSAWADGTFVTPEIDLHRTIRSSAEVKLVKPSEAQAGGTEGLAYALGAQAKRTHEVQLPTLYLSSRFARWALDPNPPYVLGDRPTLHLELSGPITRPSDDARTSGLVKIAEVHSDAFDAPYDVKVEPGAEGDREVKLEVAFVNSPGSPEVRLHLPAGDEEKAVALGKTKHFTVPLKEPPEVYFSRSQPARAWAPKQHANDEITKDPATGRFVAYVGDPIRIKLRLNKKKTGMFGAGVFLVCDAFAPLDPQQYRRVDGSTQYPGGEDLPEPEFGQTYTLELSEPGKLIHAWTGLAAADVNAPAVVQFDGKSWKKLTRLRVPARFPRQEHWFEKPSVEVQVRLVEPGDHDLTLEDPFAAKVTTTAEHAKVGFTVKDGVIRLPDPTRQKRLTYDQLEGRLDRGDKLEAVLAGGAGFGAVGVIDSHDPGANLLVVGDLEGDEAFEVGQEVIVRALDPIGRPRVDEQGAPITTGKATLTAIEDPVSWISPEGPYAVGDVIELRLERFKAEAQRASGELALLKSNAFGPRDDGPPREYKVKWTDQAALSDPIRVQLRRTTKKPWVDVAPLGTDYALRGDTRREFKVGQHRYLYFAKRHFTTKPALTLATEAELTLALSSPLQRKVEVLIEGAPLPENDDPRFAHLTGVHKRVLPVTFEPGERTRTVKLTPVHRFPTEDPDEHVLHVRWDQADFWVELEGDTDATPLLAEGDELELEPPAATGRTARVAEALAGNPAGGVAHLYLLSGCDKDPNGLALKKGSASHQVRASHPLFELAAEGSKEAAGSATLPITLEVPAVTFTDPPFSGEPRRREELWGIARGDKTRVGLRLDAPCPRDVTIHLSSRAFGEEQGLPKRVAVAVKQGEREVWSDEVTFDFPAGHDEALPLEVLVGEAPLLAPPVLLLEPLAVPALRFPPAFDAEGEPSSEAWVDPPEGEVAVGDEVRIRVDATFEPPDGKIAQAYLVSPAFEKAPFELKPGEGTTHWVTTRVTKAKQGLLARDVKIVAKHECVPGAIARRKLLVHAERKVYFTRQPLTIAGQGLNEDDRDAPADQQYEARWEEREAEVYPATGRWPAITTKFRFRVDKRGGDPDPHFPLELGEEPDVVYHPETHLVVYEVERPQGGLVPNDKVRLSVRLSVPAGKSGATVTLSGGPLASSCEATFEPGQRLVHAEVELAVESDQPKPITLSSPQGCVLGGATSYKVPCRLPKARFATPGVEPQVLRANTLAWIHVELDGPAPHLGCQLKVKWTKKGQAGEEYPYVQGKDEHGQPLADLLAYVPAGRTATKVCVRLKEQLDPAALGEYELHLEPHPLAEVPAGLEPTRCKADPERAKTTVELRDAPTVRFTLPAEKNPLEGIPVEARDYTRPDGSAGRELVVQDVDHAFEAGVEGSDQATLWLEASEAPEAPIQVTLRSKAFGPRSYLVTLPAGKTDPVAQEVQLVRGITQQQEMYKQLPFPIVLVAPEGWRADPEASRLKVRVKLPPDAKPEQECPLQEAPPGGEDPSLEEQQRALEPEPQDCNLHRLFLIEEHGDPEDDNVSWPERGADGRGTFEVVRRADHAAEPAQALECRGNEPAVLQVIAGRANDPKGDSEFHRTTIQVQLSKTDYWCDQQFFEGSPGDEEHERHLPRMHPLLTVREERKGAKGKLEFVRLRHAEVPRDVRGLIQPSEEEALRAQEGDTEGADERRQTVVFAFPVYQAHYFWHDKERHNPSPGVKGALGKALNWSGNKLKEINPADNLLSMLSWISWRPKRYLIELAACGAPRTSPLDPVGPVRSLAAVVEVWPSDEFCLSYAWSSGLETGRHLGASGSYYDPNEGFKGKSEEDDSRGTSVDLDVAEGLDVAALEAENLRPGAFLLEHGRPYEVKESPPPAEHGWGSRPSLVFHPIEGEDDDEAAFELDYGEATGPNDEAKALVDAWGDDDSVLGEVHHRWLEGGGVGTLSITRNGQSDPLYSAIANTVSALITTAQTMVESVTHLTDNFCWAYGWGVQFHCKFLEGNAQVYWGMKEHSDHRVFRWWALHADLTLVDLGVAVTFGVQASCLLAHFEAVAYFKLSVAATLNTSVEKHQPGINPLTSAGLGETWIGAAVKAEGGLNIVLVNENTFHANAALKTGFKIEFRLLNLDESPFGIEHRGFFLGVSFAVTFKVVGFKELTKEFYFVRPHSPDFPLWRKVFPRAAARGYGRLRDLVADAWKKAAHQRAQILRRLDDYQTLQLYMVRTATVHTVRRTRPDGSVEVVSKHLKTEEKPGYRYEGDRRDSDYQDGLQAWTEGKKLWDAQWSKCREAFAWEGRSVSKRRSLLSANLEERLVKKTAMADAQWAKLEERLRKLDAAIERCMELTDEIDEAADKSDRGDNQADAELSKKVKSLVRDPILNWEKRTDIQVGALRHPLLKFDDVLKDLLYYAKKRSEW